MTAPFNFIVLACWIIFFLYWAINAWRVKATAEKQSLWSALVHRLPLGCSYVPLANGQLPVPMSFSVMPHAGWAQALGVIVCVLGLLVTPWTGKTLAGN